jgi:two-component system sensor histidine kinase QseC
VKLRPTLTGHLLAWVMGGLLLVWASFVAVGWRTGQHEADELTDGHLASVAALMLAYRGGSFEAVAPPAKPVPAGSLRDHDYQRSMSVVVWDARGQVLARTGDAPLPDFAQPEGFATLDTQAGAPAWRAFSRWDAQRTRKVMVLLSVREREELAQDIAEQVTEPALWLLPAIALVLGLAIRRGLRPLYRLSQQVRELDIHDGRSLTPPTRHEELQSVVDAINTLVARYHAALERERALAGEFAHELRTPLASLSLQASALAELPEGPDRAAALGRLRQDTQRAGEVLSHLLALARAGRAQLDEAAQPVEMEALAQRVLAASAPAAAKTRHELALSSPGPWTVPGHEVLLEVALRNLVENAVSHTPAGTHVEVQIDPAAHRLQVWDDAASRSGAPAGSALGLGLGHRVVEKIAAIHGARFEALPADGSGRRCYAITFSAGRS